jgi:hypothetical protein
MFLKESSLENCFSLATQTPVVGDGEIFMIKCDDTSKERKDLAFHHVTQCMLEKNSINCPTLLYAFFFNFIINSRMLCKQREQKSVWRHEQKKDEPLEREGSGKKKLIDKKTKEVSNDEKEFVEITHKNDLMNLPLWYGIKLIVKINKEKNSRKIYSENSFGYLRRI